MVAPPGKPTEEWAEEPDRQEVRNSKKKRDLPQLVTRFPRIGSYEAKILFVKNGKYKSGVYEDPKPHDYRQYEANLPNLVTSYSRDPLNLKLKSQHLNTDPGREPPKEKQKDSDRTFLTYKPCESKWDPRLLLPKNPWPPKSASFTRHRRRRGAHTAFLDRVEEKLCRLQQGEAGRDVRVHSARGCKCTVNVADGYVSHLGTQSTAAWTPLSPVYEK
ncbi:putative uncharacterized protein C7orf78 homolog [Mycteria americana]|uniref:putative uncharacterized protein C7orf78 homolog n=1 Tax=Mycteria americana TaxID=33587 RepID=UPI003F58D6B1